MDMIPECYVPPAHIRGLRAMARQRIKAVQDRTRIINRVRSICDRHDIVIDASNMYSVKALEQLEFVSLKHAYDEIVLQQCAYQKIRCMNKCVADMDSHIGVAAGQNEDAKILASMTGMGMFTSLLLAAEIGTIERFDNPKKMVSWAGLCPTIHQSGDTMYMGKIKKIDTNSIVNWAMMEAANVAVRHDYRMKVAYESARKRHADKHALAIVVVANKMITIAWHMLKTKTPYSSHNERLYKSKLAKMERTRKKKQ